MGQGNGQTAATAGKLLKGAAILGAAAVISKLLGTLQKIPLQNIAGDSTFGIYNAVYPLYILILFLATAGFPIAVSKFVSEKVVVGDMAGARRILHVALITLAITGVAGFVLLYAGADWIAAMMGNSHTALSIRSVSFALLFVPVMSALRGYFQGFQNMTPTAISQVTEQLIRVVVMLVLLLYLVYHQYAEDWIAAGATFGSAAGAAAGLIVMLYYWNKEKREKLAIMGANHSRHQIEDYRAIARKLIGFAIPVCLGSIVVPLLNIVDAFTLLRLLKLQGFTEIQATSLYGIYNRGLPLVQLVAMLFSSVSVAIVPAIAEAKAKGNQLSVKGRAELAMRTTWLIGLASSFGLAILAKPLNIMFFTDVQGSELMAVLAFTAVFSVINIITGSILQGLGYVMIPARHLLIAALLKVICNILLVPTWGLMGAAISAVIAFGAASVLNVVYVLKYTGIKLALRTYIYQPALALLAMAISLYIVMYGLHAMLSQLDILWPERIDALCISLLSIAVGAFLYIAVLFRTGAFAEHELLYIPKFNERWRGVLQRLRILK